MLLTKLKIYLIYYKVRVKVVKGHDDAVTCCQFCFDDEKIVTGSKDKTIRLWVGKDYFDWH